MPHSRTRFLTAAALAAGSLTLAAFAQTGAQPGGTGGGTGGGQPPARQPGGPGGPGGRGEMNLEGAMKGMGRALKGLEGGIGSASAKDDNLKMIGEMQRFAVAAKGMQPPMKKVKAEEQAAFVEKFRKAQIELVRMLLDLETQVIDGKNDDAKATLAKVIKHRDASHDIFDPPAAPSK